MLVDVEEMAQILGVSVSTFRRKFLPAIDEENNKRSTSQRLYICTGEQRISRRFHPDRVLEFLLTRR